MAADILAILIKTNLAAAAAIVLALALRRPARKAFGARIAYALWLVVPLGVGASLLPARAVVVPYVAAPAPIADVAASPAVTSALTTPIASTPPVGFALVVLWLAGAAISFAFLAWSQSRFIKSLGGVAREGKFLRAKAAGPGPAVVGSLFPRIVLPADFEARYDPAEQQVVLAHEAAHLAAGDAVVNALIALAQCLCWFNPLIHLAARTVRVDQELACDAAVLSAYPQWRRPYAEALLKTQIAAAPLPLGCYWPAGASNPLKERIAMFKLQTPSRARSLIGGCAVLALCLGTAVAAWAAQPARVSFARATPAALSTTTSVADGQPMAVQMAQAATRSTPAPALITTAAPVARPVEMTQSPAGNVFQRVDANPIPARVLRVALPNGGYRTLTSARPSPIVRPGDETEAYRAAMRVFEAALEEQAARGSTGRPPQPLTPELQSALDTLDNFTRDLSARRLAEVDAKYDRFSVPLPGPAAPTTSARVRTRTVLVPKDFTVEAKARTLASLDAQIASSSPPTTEALRSVREMVAARIPQD